MGRSRGGQRRCRSAVALYVDEKGEYRYTLIRYEFAKGEWEKPAEIVERAYREGLLGETTDCWLIRPDLNKGHIHYRRHGDVWERIFYNRDWTDPWDIDER